MIHFHREQRAIGALAERGDELHRGPVRLLHHDRQGGGIRTLGREGPDSPARGRGRASGRSGQDYCLQQGANRRRMTSRAAPNEAPVVSLEKVMPRFVVIRLRRAGGGRRPNHIWGAQVSLVNGTAEPTEREAERGNKETFN